MTTIKSDFNKSAEGWTVSGNSSQGWQASGGNPGGYFGWTDNTSGSTALFVAPAKFLGDMGDFYGGKISYDIFDSSGDSQPGAPDLFLQGTDGHTIYVDLGAVGAGWTHETVKLTPGGGWIDSSTGAAATKAVMHDILDHLGGVTVRAEYFAGPESGGLDNFKLSAKDAPPALSAAFAHPGDGAHVAGHHDLVPAIALDPAHHLTIA